VAVDAAEPPVRWHTREDSGLRLDRAGRWSHDGQPLEHPRIVEAFNQGLRVTDDGRYRLEFGGDWCFVEVEDCGYTVLAVDLGPEGRRSLRLSDRTAEWLDATSLGVDVEGALTCRVKAGRARARFCRSAHLQLASDLELRDGAVVLRAGALAVATGLSPDALGGA
jgi:hypothetical protein